MRKKILQVTRTNGLEREVLNAEQRKYIRDVQRRLPNRPEMGAWPAHAARDHRPGNRGSQRYQSHSSDGLTQSGSPSGLPSL